MNSDQLIITAIYAGTFLSLFSIGELMYHWLKIKAELTRKFVHVFTGFICLTFPFYITTHWSVLILTVAFALILIISLKFGLLKSINDVDRVTRGSFLFPVSIYICFWAYAIYGHGQNSGTGIELSSAMSMKSVLSHKAAVYYFLPLIIFSISDPLAALVGKTWPIGKYTIRKETKTLAGSAAFFLSAFALSILFLSSNPNFHQQAILVSVIVALTSCIAEGISQKGFDNLLIPVAVIIILVIFK